MIPSHAGKLFAFITRTCTVNYLENHKICININLMLFTRYFQLVFLWLQFYVSYNDFENYVQRNKTKISWRERWDLKLMCTDYTSNSPLMWNESTISENRHLLKRTLISIFRLRKGKKHQKLCEAKNV